MSDWIPVLLGQLPVESGVRMPIHGPGDGTAGSSRRPLGRSVTVRKLNCSGWGGGRNSVAEGQPLVPL